MDRAKLVAINNGIIEAHSKRGRPLRLLSIPPSGNSPQFKQIYNEIKQQSRTIEKLTRTIARTTADVIRCDKVGFADAANKAGLEYFSKFCLTDMASLSSHIPLATTVVLKSMFTRTFGADPFTSPASLQKTRHQLSV